MLPDFEVDIYAFERVSYILTVLVYLKMAFTLMLRAYRVVMLL